MFEWEYLFEPHILKRGWRYANEGAVEHITRKDSQIEAIVAGSEYYKVVLDYNGPLISNAYCSCPYAAKGITVSIWLLCFMRSTQKRPLN